MATPTRRTITQGAAWAIPAITMATAAPALAASPTGVALVRYTRYSTSTAGCTNGQYTLLWEGTTQGTYGVTLQNSRRTSVTVTGLYIMFWVSVNNLALRANSGYTNWSTPAATGASQVIGNVTYYQYRSNYSGTVTIPANSTSYVSYSFSGTICRSGTTYITGGQGFATIDGSTPIQSDASAVRTTCDYSNGCTPP